MTNRPGARVLTTPVEPVDESVVAEAAAALRAGRLVAIPTETVYGLACHALDPDAVTAVFAAKERPTSDPLIVHVDGLDMAVSVVDGPLPPAAAVLAEQFWPGPLTLVLPRAASVPDAVTSGLDTVGVRCPSHPVAAAIISAAGVPLAAPSANRFGRISPTAAEHVVDELGDRIDLIVDAGRTDRGVESTVVSFDGDTAVVLRHGAVTLEDLRAHVNARDVGADEQGAMAASPGHDERHYSPGTPTVAVTADALDASITAHDADDVVYLGYRDRPPAIPAAWQFEALGTVADPAGVAHHLYATLRRVDEQAPRCIVVELSGADGLGRAVDDRLTRAASSRVADTPDRLRELLADGPDANR